jgi:hypothetical protein
MFLGRKTGELLEYVLEKGIMLNLSYMEQGRWYAAAAKIATINPESFVAKIETITKAHPLNLSPEQLVGVCFQCDGEKGHDKFIFGTSVVSSTADYDKGLSQSITLTLPEEIEVVRRKSYLRVNVPDSINVEAQLWHRGTAAEDNGRAVAQVCHGFAAELVSLAADRLEVAVSTGQGPDFSKGQYVGLKFTPLKNETPISLNAYVRHVLPTWEAEEFVIELEMVGLEVSPEGRMVLRRLCNVVSRYRAMLYSAPVSGVVPVRHAATT